MKLTRRGLFGLIAAIPLAGISGFRPEKALTWVPLHLDRTQEMANRLFTSHLQNMKLALYQIPEKWIYSDRMVEEEDLR